MLHQHSIKVRSAMAAESYAKMEALYAEIFNCNDVMKMKSLVARLRLKTDGVRHDVRELAAMGERFRGLWLHETGCEVCDQSEPMPVEYLEPVTAFDVIEAEDEVAREYEEQRRYEDAMMEADGVAV